MPFLIYGIPGLLLIVIGFLTYKFPKQVLTIFGARILILLPERQRPKALQTIALIEILIGVGLLIWGFVA